MLPLFSVSWVVACTPATTDLDDGADPTDVPTASTGTTADSSPVPPHTGSPAPHSGLAHTGVAHSGRTDDATPSAGCSGGAGLTDGVHTLLVDGEPRQYTLQAPPAAGPVPLVLDLHGLGADMDDQRRLSGLDGVAADEGWVIAWPDSRADGPVKAFTLTCRSPDLDFLTALTEEIGEALCIDTSRVFLTGMSNGAFLTHLALARDPTVYRAAAPISGGIGFLDECPPTAPAPILQVHGTTDEVVPYEDGRSARDVWFAANGCVGTATDADGCEVGTGCLAEQRFCPADGVGHFTIYRGYPTTERIRAFFAAY